jgi:preprotein translocase subunit SecG
MVMLALMYLMVLTLWCIIGVLLSPSKMAPYAAAVITFVAHAASLFARLKKVSALHRITYESECCLAALGVVF